MQNRYGYFQRANGVLRCQRLGRSAACDGHVDVFTGEGVGKSLAYLTESYNRIAHNAFPIW